MLKQNLEILFNYNPVRKRPASIERFELYKLFIVTFLGFVVCATIFWKSRISKYKYFKGCCKTFLKIQKMLGKNVNRIECIEKIVKLINISDILMNKMVCSNKNNAQGMNSSCFNEEDVPLVNEESEDSVKSFKTCKDTNDVNSNQFCLSNKRSQSDLSDTLNNNANTNVENARIHILGVGRFKEIRVFEGPIGSEMNYLQDGRELKVCKKIRISPEVSQCKVLLNNETLTTG